MNILDKNSYSNQILEAVVVNINSDLDPQGKGRVQLYIPALQIDYATDYVNYAKTSDDQKKNAKGFSYYPWATSLIDNLELGHRVLCCNINNSNSEYAIMGIDVKNSKDADIDPTGTGGAFGLSGNASGLLDLAMPIILQNEVSLSINAWPDNIPDENYKKITPYDKGCKCTNKSTCGHSGGWSIGLIQWHHGRAFNLMYDIVKEDNNWKSKSPNQNLDIVKDLASSIKNNSTHGYASKYTDNYHPTSGTDPYRFIQNVLGSSTGKRVQKEKAKADTAEAIELVTGESYGVSNPAIVIFLVDILNQYGNGKTTTIKKAAEISKSSGDMIKQLDEFKKWCEGNLGDYWSHESRRNRTYNYVKQLYNAGKLYVSGGPMTVANFVKRTTCPSSTDYWYSSARPNPAYNMWTNNGNCAYYGWARASEILGRNYDGATGNGVNYGDEDGKYKRGSTPRQGAIITWSGGSKGAGHVAIVEDVSADGNTIWTSESGWRSFYFKYKERKNDGNWGAGSKYKCRGFKYLI